MTNFSERLMYFIENQLHISVREFEKNANLPQGSIQRAINGTNMGIDKLSLISQYYTDLNMDWLISGEGNMIDKDENSSNIASEPIETYNTSHVQSAILVIAESNKLLSETNAKLTEKLMHFIEKFEYV